MPPVRWATSTNSASCTIRAATGIVVPGELAGPALAVPALVRRAERVEHRGGQAELARRGSGRAGRGWAIMPSTLLVAAETRSRSATRTRCSGLRRRRAAAASRPSRRALNGSCSYFVAFSGDVVAEPARLLVGVGVAAHVDQQRGVVDGGALGLVEADQLADPQRDAALAQHVLHRLAEAEVDPERQRGQQLGQPHRCRIGLVTHRAG